MFFKKPKYFLSNGGYQIVYMSLSLRRLAPKQTSITFMYNVNSQSIHQEDKHGK